MVKLYDRSIKLITWLASLDWELIQDEDEMEEMIVEARAILREIEAIS